MIGLNSADFATAFKDILWPRVCLSCGAATMNSILCDECIVRSKPDSGQFEIASSDRVLPAFALWKFDIDAPVRALLHRLKYGNCPWIGNHLGVMIADSGSLAMSKGWDIIVPVPLHAKRLLERGYNQSEWIADGLGKELGVPVAAAELARSKNTMTQTNLTREQREINVSGAFSLNGKRDIGGASVMLVDDTITTGSTLYSAAETLLAAGATVVQPVAVARAALRLDEEQADRASVIPSQNPNVYHASSILSHHL